MGIKAFQLSYYWLPILTRLQPLHNISQVYQHSYQCADKIGRYSQRLRESRKLNLTELRLKFKRLFQLVTFCIARNLLDFSSCIETLDLYYRGAIRGAIAHRIIEILSLILSIQDLRVHTQPLLTILLRSFVF